MPNETPPENQNPEPISQPPATPEPTEPTSIPPSISEQVEVPPVAPESPTKAESVVPVNDDIEQIEPESSPTEQTAQIEEVEENKPVSEAPAQPTARRLDGLRHR